jgi:uncharacterized repeat protein (TIGR01451 family)
MGTSSSRHKTQRHLPRPFGVFHRDSGGTRGRSAVPRGDSRGGPRRRSMGALWGAAIAFAAVLLAAAFVHAGELVQNGSFETGSFGTYWTHGAYRGSVYNPALADHIVVPDLPYTGSYSARLGFKYSRERRSAVGFMYQDVAIPANISSARLFFKVRQQGYDTNPFDPFRAQVRRTDNTVLQTLLTLTFSDPSYVFKDGGWVDDNNVLPAGVDMAAYAGQTVRVYFEQANTNDNFYETWAYVDDVSLVFKRFVDLAVDGNGNDLFGALGSGAGGLSAGSTLAGDSLFFDLGVENEGLDADSYRITIAAPAGWTVRIENGSGWAAFPYAMGTLTPGAVEHRRVLVLPPPGTPAGSYSAVLDAVSVSQPNRFDSVRMGVAVLDATYGADLAVDGNGYGVVGDNGSGGFAIETGSWDTYVAYALELTNTGNASSAFRVAAAPDPGAAWRIRYNGVTYTSGFVTASVAPGASASMTLETAVPRPRPGGDYATIVRAQALADTLKRDSVRAVLRLIAPRVDLLVGGNGDGIYDGTQSGLGGSSSGAGEPGIPFIFPVRIQNEGGIPDSYNLTWAKPTGGWTAAIVLGGVEYAFPYTTPVVGAYSSLDLELKIYVPSNAKVGTYSSFLNAVSRAENAIAESVTAAVSVTTPGQIDLIIDGSGVSLFGPLGSGLGGDSERTLSPGDSATFSIELRNLTGANAADLSWNTPAGWRVTLDGRASPLTGYPSGIYPLKVVVPAASPGGTFDIIVDGLKTDRRFFVDSIRGRVYVTPPMVVDALIDGNGDGLYGALGTGLGGSSSQTRSGPAVLRFTVELENEGAAADSYTIAWNAIPWWRADVEGSAAPYTTGPVGAGGFSFLTFEVEVPASAAPGAYRYVLDVTSNANPGVVESIEARVTIVGPPRADLVLDGNGLGVFGSLGSGDGAFSLHPAAPGSSYTAVLEVRNAGSYADSFYVFWEVPAGWPSNAVVLSDGTRDFASPLWTPTVGAGGSAFYTVKVQVPPAAGPGLFSTIIDSHSSLAPRIPESARLATMTGSVVRGFVFDDRDHDGVFGAADAGLGGVTVSESATGIAAVTSGDGRYSLLLPAGLSTKIAERNLPGFVSLSPDTVGPAALAAGDTLVVDFADVPGIRLSAGVVSNAAAGGYADFPHRLDAGTSGAVALTATADSSATAAVYLDVDEDGALDAVDRPIVASDLDMDPAAGKDHACLIVRLFIPPTAPVGSTWRVTVDAVQTIEGTAFTSSARAFDAAVVTDGSLLALAKRVDAAAATPGTVLTYTISFTNTGLDSVQNVTLLDPVSVHVDPVAGGFGPGMDVEWRKDGSTVVYLTLDPADGDECEYSAADRVLRLVFSKNSPYRLEPGEGGELSYRVIVK